MLLRLSAEPKFVDSFDNLAEIVAAVDLILGFAKNFTNLVFDGVWSRSPPFETLQIGKQFQH